MNEKLLTVFIRHYPGHATCRAFLPDGIHFEEQSYYSWSLPASWELIVAHVHNNSARAVWLRNMSEPSAFFIHKSPRAYMCATVAHIVFKKSTAKIVQRFRKKLVEEFRSSDG